MFVQPKVSNDDSGHEAFNALVFDAVAASIRPVKQFDVALYT